MNAEYIVVSYLLENHKSIPVALDKIKPSYFTDKVLRGLFKIIVRGYTRKEYINYNVLDLMLRKKKYGKSVYVIYQNLLEYKNRDSDEFIYALKELNISYKKKLMIQGLTKVSQDLMTDDVNSAFEGLDSLTKKISLVKKSDGLLQELKHGIRTSFKTYKQAEKEASGESTTKRIKTGFTFIDQITGGMKPGELWMWGGYTGTGKTQFAKEIAYYNYIRGKHVVLASLEMSDNEIRLMMETRHSHKFKEGGLYYKQIEMGLLKKKDREVYYETLKDLHNNKKYGKLTMWFPEFGCSVGSLKNKLESIHIKNPIDLVILDYIDLLEADEHIRGEERNKVTYKCKVIKDIARTFDNNKGIPIFSPHQISRQGSTAAAKRGYHELSDLAESAGVERTANLVGWNLRTEELRMENKIRIGISKYRTGDINPRGAELMSDFAHSLIAEIEDVQSFNDKLMTD